MVDEFLLQPPADTRLTVDMDGITIQAREVRHSLVFPGLRMLDPTSPAHAGVMFLTALAGACTPIFLLSVMLSAASAAGVDFSEAINMLGALMLIVGVPGGIIAGLRLPRSLYRLLSRARSGALTTMRLGLHDFTFSHSGQTRTVSLSEVLFVDSNIPPKLVLQDAVRLDFAANLNPTTQRWLVLLLKAAIERKDDRGAGEAEIPAALLAMQKQRT